MNKNEFLRRLSLETGFSKNICGQLLKSGMDIVRSELNTGGEVVFKKFGKIFVGVRGERLLKLDHKEILVPSKIETRIKLFKSFKNIVK